MEEINYPLRINKYLALKNICSRREADVLIADKKVKINGKLAQIGDKVQSGDKVLVENFNKKNIYIAFNKPRGVITHSPQMGEKAIKDLVDLDGVFPLGRLDKDSSGLIILTDDGRVTDKLLNPKYKHDKEYIVRVSKSVTESFFKKMTQGVKLEDGYVTKKCQVEKIANDRIKIILNEGKKHQIRRMCDAFGYNVVNLQRRRIMNIRLGNLVEGDWREIKGKELVEFLQQLEIK